MPQHPSIRADKALGQHFLFDPAILAKIACATGPIHGTPILEIGPGPGGLTRALLEAGAAPLIAIEKDSRFAAALQEWPQARSGALRIIQADACQIDWPQLLAEQGIDTRVHIIANLPYNVATPLLSRWVKAGSWRGSMALMVQKEVAQRVCADPGGRDYGRLSVLVAARMQARMAFSLPPGAFRPPPKIDSALLVLDPLPIEAQFPHITALEDLTRAAFAQRRKMLRSALRPLLQTMGQDCEIWLSDLGIDPCARAQSLDQQAFRKLADAFHGLQQRGVNQ